MAKLTSEADFKAVREGGRRLGIVLSHLEKITKPGITAKELNDTAEKMIRDFGDEPAFLNYTPDGANRPYPATLCVSINNEIVHGIPNEKEKIIRDGDLVSLDLGLRHEGWFVDSAITVCVGNVDKKGRELSDATYASLLVGISVCRAGNHISDIGCAIESFAKPLKYGLVEELGGHGVGRRVHEEPHIVNYCAKGKTPVMVPGMLIALEPMLNEGSRHIILEDDGYTFSTADNKRSAHWEHTVLITDGEPEVVTKREGEEI